MLLLDFLFPRTCVGCGKRGIYFCDSCVSSFAIINKVCPMCVKDSIGGVVHAQCKRPYGLDGLVSVFSYKLGIEEAVKRLKYRFVQDLGEAFVDVSVKRMGGSFREFVKREGFIIVPVPLHRARKRWRGFNQAALLGKILAIQMRLQYKNILIRTKNTGSLAELRVRLTDKEKKQLDNKYASGTQRRIARKRKLLEKKNKARAEQMRGAFELNSKFKIKNAKLLLVDDVWTSGATMLECTKALKRAKANVVWGFTFARSGR